MRIGRRRRQLAPLPLKNPQEIAILREAGRIVAEVHAELKKAIGPSVSTQELDELAADCIRRHGARSCFLNYKGFPSHTCVSVNEQMVHGIPSSKRRLRAGDIVSIDVGVKHRGYIGDRAWTYPVGDISAEARHLLKVTKESLYAGIKAAQPGRRILDVSRAVQRHVEGNNLHVAREYTGHGVGRQMHEPPNVRNFVDGGPEPRRRMPEGLVFALEPMVLVGTQETETLDDNWTVISKDRSLTAHFEHTIAVVEGGPRILTAL